MNYHRYSDIEPIYEGNLKVASHIKSLKVAELIEKCSVKNDFFTIIYSIKTPFWLTHFNDEIKAMKLLNLWFNFFFDFTTKSLNAEIINKHISFLRRNHIDGVYISCSYKSEWLLNFEED